MLFPLLMACTATPPADDGPGAHHDFAATQTDFRAAPFPSAHRLGPGGTVDLGAFPNPDGTPIIADLLGLLHGRAPGFSSTAGITFRVDVDLAPDSLPGLASSIGDGAAYLMDVDPDSPDLGQRLVMSAHYESDAGPFGGERLLTLLPLQGAPLRPDNRYAAVLTTALMTTDGQALAPWTGAMTLATGGCPAGLSGQVCVQYRAALAAIPTAAGQVAGLAAFTTQDPTAALRNWSTHAREATPAAPPQDLVQVEQFDNYCVLQGSTTMPVYQSGDPPYLDSGGEILLADDGAPMLDHWETARVVLTLPIAAAPTAGFPVVIFIRTGGGGDRPLVDRGVRDAGGQVQVAGSGLAQIFAAAGYAAVSVDGPHGGLRNVSGGDEQFLIFNVANPAAMADNLRQSALELALLPAMLAETPVQDCDGGSAALDLETLVVFGHSMGATIAPLMLGVTPEVHALILSGAGGSWIENIVHKQSPLVVRPIAEAMLGYDDRTLTASDPALQLLQWAGEGADPPVWGADIQAAGTHVLMVQGIVDTYILPPIANSATLAHGLDLGGPALDQESPALVDYDPLSQLLPYVGGQELDLPASANRDGVTRIVVQHLEDGVEDGHEVVFQLDEPKAQLQRFLEDLAAGQAPTVVE